MEDDFTIPSEMDEEGEFLDDYYGDNLYGDGAYEGPLYEDEQMIYQRIPLLELADNCALATLLQVLGAICPLMAICFLSRLTHMFFKDDESRVKEAIRHTISVVCGLLAANLFFETTIIYLLILAVVPYLQLIITSARPRGHNGPMTAGLVVAFLLSCELLIVENEDWHRIRGAQMVVAMKVISIGFDLDQGVIKAMPTVWQYAGYLFHPGSIVFGPWISILEYNMLFKQRRIKLDFAWLLKAVCSTILGLLCLMHSTCLVHWLILDHWGRWFTAYRDAQGFRFSHYFVSYMSEATTTLSGLGSSVGKSSSNHNGRRGSGTSVPPKGVITDVKWDLSVAKPLNIELPRSLTEVVANWNLPMHFWLRNYVFRPARPFGTFTAVILTYAASSILHGMNFQLAAVLLSLGFYSYVEHELRKKLSRTFDACIGAKRCKETCDHHYKSTHLAVITTNVALGLLAVFHLAYLGLMFDNSDTQVEGYNMGHTLSKWASLDYASHWVALATYIVYLLI